MVYGDGNRLVEGVYAVDAIVIGVLAVPRAHMFCNKTRRLGGSDGICGRSRFSQD